MPNPALTIELIDAFGAGVYLLTTLTHADLWWHRRDRPAHLWLALSAFGALLVNITGAYNRHVGESANHWLLLLNFLGIVVALVSLFELVQSLRRRRTGKFLRAMQFLMLLPIVLAPIGEPDVLMTAIFSGSILFLIAAMILAFRQSWSGDAESRVLTIGLLILFSTLIYDLLSELRVFPHVQGTPVFGFTLLYAAAARALSLRYDREHRELLDLRGELEARVLARTAELEAANLELDRLSRTDPLTGLANRRSFIHSAARLGIRDKALLMLDIDHFKQINDRHGHEAGDLVLRGIATALSASLHAPELVARWGGEEFILLLNEDGSGQRAEQLRQRLADLQVHIDGCVIPVSASFGLSSARPDDTLDERLASADRALYRAKAEGRNRVVVADA